MWVFCLQVSEYFADFDYLRSGSITKAQFERGLSQLGLSSMGHHNLSPAQLQTLLHLYENPNDSMRVVWTDFAKDLESGKCAFYYHLLDVFRG